MSGLIACSGGWEQDPLKGANQAILDGQPPSTKPEVPTPVVSEAIRIDSADIVNLQEETETAVEIKARTLMKGYSVKVEIENLANFKGAKFDSASGKFTWTPEKGSVVDVESSTYPLNVLVIAKGSTPKDVDLVRRKTIQLNVFRLFMAPTIESVKDVESSVREGKVDWFEITVKDPDGGLKTDEAPVLQILNPSFLSSIASYVFIEDVVAGVGNKTWIYKMKIDLKDAEITDSSENFGFRIRAVNRFGRSSAEQELRTKVYTQLTKMDTSWVSEVEMTPAQENVYPFLVYDLKREGRITIQTSNLPTGAKVECPSASVGIISCQFKWNPAYNTGEQKLEFVVTAKSKNTDTSDNQEIVTPFKMKIKVKHVPQPPPPAPPSQPGQPGQPNPPGQPGQPGPTPLPGPRPEPTDEERG